jgi:hypothetical protein
MNNLKIKRLTVLLFAMVCLSTLSFSQFNMDLLKGGTADGSKIVREFMSPWAKAFGAGLNGSWYNTAKPHKLGGFDITASINLAFVPSSATTFDLGKLGLQTIKFDNATASTLTPTIAGAKDVGPALYFEKTVPGYPAVRVADFHSPAGTGIKFMIAPTAQIGIGLPLGTEVKFRYIPRIPVRDYGDVSLWGVGLMHSIMQYVPGNDLLPFDLSLFGGYTKLLVNVPISMQPADYSKYSAAYTSASFTDQGLATTITALNASLVGSVKLLVFTFYGSLGYVKTNTDLEFQGIYPFPGVNTTTAKVEYIDANVKKIDPISIPSYSGLKSTIGFRLKLAVITINVDYTKAQYNVVSAGLGISFR